jgi:hypothetical protein
VPFSAQNPLFADEEQQGLCQFCLFSVSFTLIINEERLMEMIKPFLDTNEAILLKVLEIGIEEV